ncbi:hypothetical protein HpBGD68_15070 [Helicobacter pylori]
MGPEWVIRTSPNTAQYFNAFPVKALIVFVFHHILLIGLEKLGHPQPESYLSAEENNGSPVVTSLIHI